MAERMSAEQIALVDATSKYVIAADITLIGDIISALKAEHAEVERLQAKPDCEDPVILHDMELMERHIDDLEAEVERLQSTLREISKGAGAFSMDPHEHAVNCIEDMKMLALEALADSPEQS